MTVDLTPQARAAADWLEDHEWVQGDWGDATTKACLHGAVRSCTPQTGDGYLVSAVLIRQGLIEHRWPFDLTTYLLAGKSYPWLRDGEVRLRPNTGDVARPAAGKH